MKKLLNMMLMVALMSGLSQFVTSCKDDDDKNTSEERNNDADPLDTDEAQTAWRWLCALTNTETLTSDWNKKTYEPTVGVASENNANTRIVVVADLDEAKTKFASLSGASVSELGGELTVSQGGVGRLTWTPSKAGAQNLAEVTVDTKLIPRLTKIVYCTEDQVGVNGGLFGDTVTGTAYYRLGDVIEDGEGYYWVCVRPSFDQGNKGKSHWINIFNASSNGRGTDGNLKPIPEGNVYNKYDNLEKYNYRTILLPTKLKYSREHMNNLGNLVYALLNPEDYAQQVGTDENLHNNGLCGFDYQYHGELFLKAVAKYWDQPTANGHTVWEVLFNCSRKTLKTDMKNLYFTYQGYQWRVGRTGYVWEFEVDMAKRFQKSTPGSESGDKKLYNLADDGYDINIYAGDGNAKMSNINRDNVAEQFDDGDFCYVVRYKTGQELMGNGTYTAYSEINGCKEIYRYNNKTGKQTQQPVETEKDLEKLLPPEKPNTVTHNTEEVEHGCLIAKNGYFYKTAADCTLDNTEPVGVVVAKGGALEDDTNYNILCMALGECTDVQSGSPLIAWSETLAACQKGLPKDNQTVWMSYFDGLAATKKLSDGCGMSHVHPAAKAAWEFNLGIDSKVMEAQKISRCFLPSVGQVIIFLMDTLPVSLSNNGFRNSQEGGPALFKTADIVQKLADKSGLSKEQLSDLGLESMLTSSSVDNNSVIAFESSEAMALRIVSKTDKFHVRPFFLVSKEEPDEDD